jgi:hypothetical protein
VPREGGGSYTIRPMWLTLIYGAAALAFRNPLIADRSYYSAAPAALVVDDVLYIAAGRDEAPPDVNDFIMREWQLFATKDVSRGKWTHYPGSCGRSRCSLGRRPAALPQPPAAESGRFVGFSFPRVVTGTVRLHFEGPVAVQEWEVLGSLSTR